MPLSGLPLIPSRTWAARGTGAADGEIVRITDYGGPMGFLVCWSVSLSRWVALHPIDLAAVTALTSGVAQTAEQILPGQILIPAGLLIAFRKMRVFIGYAKTGTTDSMTNGRHRLGTAGTTSDTQISNTIGTAIVTASRSNGVETDFQITNSTTLTRIGNAGTGTWAGTGSAVATGGTATIADMSSNALYFSNVCGMSGTTDTPQLAGFVLELLP